MKLVIIYGPPAAGKLSAAQEVAPALSYSLVDTNFTSSLSRSLFKPGTPEYQQLNLNMRLMLIQAAARAQLPGIVMNYCYMRPHGDATIAAIRELCAQENIELKFVYLNAREELLLSRVTNKDRAPELKITDVDMLEKILKQHTFGVITYVESLCIDSSELALDDVCAKIIKYVGSR